MSDILIGQSYFLRFDPKLWAAMQPYPPLGALYAAAYVRERGYTVALFDAMLAASEEEWARALDRSASRRRALRGQFQLPVEDVPAAHARGGVHHDRHGARPWLHGCRGGIGRHRPLRPVSRSRRRLRDPWRGRAHPRRAARRAPQRARTTGRSTINGLAFDHPTAARRS